MTLTEFLLARLAEDEANIQSDYHWMSIAPKRLGADCEAKLRIVTACSEVATIDRDSLSAIFAIDACRYTLRAMADVYADHPDYRGEWKS